jgi:UDP-N-acetylmuramyl-tripeptide synthetase
MDHRPRQIRAEAPPGDVDSGEGSSEDRPFWFRALDHPRLVSGSLAEAASVRHDQRTVQAADVFVAIPGAVHDGHDYIEDAIARGAHGVIVQADRREKWRRFEGGAAAIVEVTDSRAALAAAAAGLADFPARALGMVGVTGTDGKTTTTHLAAHVLSACGLRAGYLSSVAFDIVSRVENNASHMTTLEADDVQRSLASMRDAGAAFAVVEASSIGLEMHRVDHCEFDVGVFTNLSQDHLDYHGTMEAYAAAKARLFRMLDASSEKPGARKAAVLNADDQGSEVMRASTEAPAITYALRAESDIGASEMAPDGLATRFRATMLGDEIAARLPLLGEFNVANSLAAVAVAVSQGVDFRDAVSALESFPGVPGRLEAVDAGQPFRVLIDIASTEQAMRNVLGVLRPHTSGRLIVVFGAAGERDRARRSGIARAVAESADAAIVTNEDPRGADPAEIAAEIEAALHDNGFPREAIVRELDRRAAIGRAFAMAVGGDTVLLAGKANEPSIVIGDVHHPWDERAVALSLLGAGARSV